MTAPGEVDYIDHTLYPAVEFGRSCSKADAERGAKVRDLVFTLCEVALNAATWRTSGAKLW